MSSKSNSNIKKRNLKKENSNNVKDDVSKSSSLKKDSDPNQKNKRNEKTGNNFILFKSLY